MIDGLTRNHFGDWMFGNDGTTYRLFRHTVSFMLASVKGETPYRRCFRAKFCTPGGMPLGLCKRKSLVEATLNDFFEAARTDGVLLEQD